MSDFSSGCALYCEVGFQANKLRNVSFDVKLMQEVSTACEMVALMERLTKNDGEGFIVYKSKSGAGDFGVDIFGEYVKEQDADLDRHIVGNVALKTIRGCSLVDCLRKAVEYKERSLSGHE